MRGQRVDIKGINRLIGSADNDDGFCTELINLADKSGIKVIGQREVASANIPFTRIRMHRINKTINYIGIQDDANGVKVVHFDPRSGKILNPIKDFPAGSDIEYAFLNNQIVISDRTSIKEYVFIFKDTYVPLYEGLEFDVRPKVEPSYFSHSTSAVDFSRNKTEFLASCAAEINKFKRENKNYCEGMFMYCFTVTLYDGTETGMYGLTSTCTQYNQPRDKYDAFISPDTSLTSDGNIMVYYCWNDFYQSFSMTIGNNGNLLDYKDLIKSVNLYVSIPISKMPIMEDNVGVNISWRDSGEVLNVPPDAVKINVLDNDKTGFEKTLLYKQKSWSLEEFSRGFEYTLEFGGDKQAAGATMEVYATNADRAGKMYTYNNRVHFYDSNVRISPELSDMTHPRGKAEVNATVIVKVRTGDKDCVFRYDDVVLSTTAPDAAIVKLFLPEMVIFPDSRAYQMDIIVSSTDMAMLAGKKLTLPLTSSPAYNYAYCFCGEYFEGEMTTFDGIYPTLSDTYTETNVVNVTASGNAMVFPVEHSYKFDGNITSVAVSMESISDVQVGQYPLNVFTDNGIYALEQGTGEVLYSRITPISGDICDNDNIIFTRQGLAYISNGGVYILAGRRSTCISTLLDNAPDLYIQDNDSFVRCCGGSLYDITPYLSMVRFRDYVEDANLCWCPETNELIVSNPNYSYSYVYDFIFNSWHKEIGTFEPVGSNLMLKPVEMNSKNATPATAKITLSAVHAEQARNFNSRCYASFNTSLSCGAGHTIALILDGTQIASASFSQITRMNMIIATLCEDIGYLEDYKGTIYSSTDLTSKVIKAYNITTGVEMWSATFSASAQSVNIPNKAIGSVVSVTIGGRTYSKPFTANDTVITVMSDLAADINNGDVNVSAHMLRNTITLTAREAGSAANSIQISASCTDNEYLYINSSSNTLTGGADISLQPSQYKEMIDWSKQKEGSQQIIHLHTRPLHLSEKNTYKTIKRTALNCLAQLNGQQNLSMYIYGSNNLTKWKCICAAQRKDCDISQITTDRAAKAYKHFIIMIGGIVPQSTELSDIILAIEDVADKKLR